MFRNVALRSNLSSPRALEPVFVFALLSRPFSSFTWNIFQSILLFVLSHKSFCSCDFFSALEFIFPFFSKASWQFYSHAWRANLATIIMAAKPRTEMTPEELAKQEEQEFNTGPLSVLTQSVKNNTQVWTRMLRCAWILYSLTIHGAFGILNCTLRF